MKKHIVSHLLNESKNIIIQSFLLIFDAFKKPSELTKNFLRDPKVNLKYGILNFYKIGFISWTIIFLCITPFLLPSLIDQIIQQEILSALFIIIVSTLVFFFIYFIIFFITYSIELLLISPIISILWLIIRILNGKISFTKFFSILSIYSAIILLVISSMISISFFIPDSIYSLPLLSLIFRETLQNISLLNFFGNTIFELILTIIMATYLFKIISKISLMSKTKSAITVFLLLIIINFYMEAITIILP